MSYSTVRDKIEAILNTATGIGKVYDYDRLERSESGFKTAFTSGSKINAWTISRFSVAEIQEASLRTNANTVWIIRGYYSLDAAGASEHNFQELIESIRSKFREKPTLDGLVLTTSFIQVNIIEPRMFGAVLCHYTELRLETTEEISYVEA